jgi:hypothetical protein
MKIALIFAALLIPLNLHSQVSVKSDWQWPLLTDSQPKEDDIFEIHPKTKQKYNVSLEKRRIEAAGIILAQFKKEVGKLDDTNLFDLLIFADSTPPPTGSQYYLARDGNKLIIAEIGRRRPRVDSLLAEHSKDRRPLFTGSSGPLLTLEVLYRRTGSTLP